jgi:hypothetical protein
METEGRSTRNQRTAAGLTETAWADAFLTACRAKRLPGFDIPSEAILLSEIEFLCREAPEDTRSRMRAGAATAAERYNPRQYSMEVLHELASIVAATVATEAVPHLVRHFMTLHPYFKQEDTPQFALAIELVSALRMFPTNPQVARLFRTLLFEETDPIHYRFAGMLTVAVIRNDSTAFIPAMNRFCQLRLHGPERFHNRTIMRAIFEAVLPMNMRLALEKKSGLSEEAKLYITKWAIELEVLDNEFEEPRTTQKRKGASSVNIAAFPALKPMYVILKAKQGVYSDLRKVHKQKAARLRKEGLS